jgi:ESCRT-I complex subunit TSG101
MSLTRSWLIQNVHAYTDKDRVCTDIEQTLANFPTIRPKSDLYSEVSPTPSSNYSMPSLTQPLHLPNNVIYFVISAYDDGRTQLLLCLHGLLPISYRQASYNIPVAVWLSRDYPRNPPLTYVVPTADMLVKPGPYIDLSGRCNVDYIQHWQSKSEVGPA